MNQNLQTIFGELGLAQYLDAFVDQGFDTWDTILDIQESDLDALGVKLGHRRKLQRRIANARGVAFSVSLATPATAASEDVKQDSVRREAARAMATTENTGVGKRKYRRHPKPDENAPERPPSAYVLFSNKMREDVKGQNLTFTEIAKLVGEHWQSLASAEKEAYESQANAAKEKYHRDLAEYKKTSEHLRYAQYLQEFKERQTQHSQSQDAVKRSKLEPPRLRHGSTSSSSAKGSGTNSSRSGSSSDRAQGSEPPVSRHHRVNSTTSMTCSRKSSITPTGSGTGKLADTATHSPRSSYFESKSPRESRHAHSRRPSRRNKASPVNVAQQSLPSLSHILDDGNRGAMDSTGPSEGNPYSSGFVAANPRRPIVEGPTAMPPAQGRPLLHHEPSSNGSSGSGSSGGSFSRGPGEGSLPIHALLTHRGVDGAPPAFEKQPTSLMASAASTSNQSSPPFGLSGYGFQSGSTAFQDMRVEQLGEGDVSMTPVEAATNPHSADKANFDGMSALLRAGEIVGRHNR